MAEAREVLFRIDRALRHRGHQMPDEAMAEAYRRLDQPQVLAMIDRGQVSVEQMVDEIERGLGAVKERRARRQGPQGQMMMRRDDVVGNRDMLGGHIVNPLVQPLAPRQVERGPLLRTT